MKKTISIILSLIMILALCVPVFATNPIVAEGSDSSSVVKTSLGSLPSVDGYFTVTFPAETVIPWAQTGDSVVDVEGCVLDSHLASGKTLEVKVAGVNGELSAAGLSTKLAYNVIGESTVNKNNPVVNNLTFTPQIEILASQWSQAIVGDYSDNITFTATIKDIVAP